MQLLLMVIIDVGYLSPYPIYLMLDRFSYSNLNIYILIITPRISDLLFLFYIERFLTNRKLKSYRSWIIFSASVIFLPTIEYFHSVFYKHFDGNTSDKIAWLVPRLQEVKRINSLAVASHNFTSGIASLPLRCMVIVSSTELHAFWNGFRIHSFLSTAM